MKLKAKSRGRVIFLGLAAMVLGLGAAKITGVLPAFARTLTEEENVYGSVEFDEEYAVGYLDFSTAVCSEKTRVVEEPSGPEATEGSDTETEGEEEEPWEDLLCQGENTEKSEDYYILYPEGAVYNGERLDVKEFIWADSEMASTAWKVAATGGVTGMMTTEGAATINREFHFYTAGTTNEVTFSGVIKFDDLDTNEGYELLTVYDGVWVTSATTTKHAEETDIWLGNSNTTSSNDNGAIWVTARGNASGPIHVAYTTPSAESSSITAGKIYTMTLEVPAEVGEAKTIGVNAYGLFDITGAEYASSGWDLAGWYTDADYQNEVTDMATVTSNLTFYGKFTPGEGGTTSGDQGEGTIGGDSGGSGSGSGGSGSGSSSESGNGSTSGGSGSSGASDGTVSGIGTGTGSGDGSSSGSGSSGGASGGSSSGGSSGSGSGSSGGSSSGGSGSGGSGSGGSTFIYTPGGGSGGSGSGSGSSDDDDEEDEEDDLGDTSDMDFEPIVNYFDTVTDDEYDDNSNFGIYDIEGDSGDGDYYEGDEGETYEVGTYDEYGNLITGAGSGSAGSSSDGSDVEDNGAEVPNTGVLTSGSETVSGGDFGKVLVVIAGGMGLAGGLVVASLRRRSLRF